MSDAPVSNTFPYRPPKGARRPRDPDAPAHYRLSAATWELILKEYREGATATFLASKWRVSTHAVRKRITQHGATKRVWGDAEVLGQAMTREAELEEARRNSADAISARLFDGIAEATEEEAYDAAALSRTAVLASGRAMRGRLWSEAKALAGLAESYSRLGGKDARPITIETMDPWDLLELIADPDGRIPARFAHSADQTNDPEAEVKAAYWRWQTNIHKAVSNNLNELMLRALYAEKQLKALGGELKLNETDVEIEAWAREWLSGPPSEANVHARTKMGAWPWR